VEILDLLNDHSRLLLGSDALFRFKPADVMQLRGRHPAL
jgi:hypothetical protein